MFDETDHSHVADRRIQDSAYYLLLSPHAPLQTLVVCAAEVYATIGHNACLEARPAVVHFGGFTLGNVHEQRIRLCNTSPSSTRMHIVLPTTTYFKVAVTLAPLYVSVHSKSCCAVTVLDSSVGVLREQERPTGTRHGGCHYC